MDADVYAGMMLGTIDGASAFTSGQVRIRRGYDGGSGYHQVLHKYVDPTPRKRRS